MRNAVGDLAGSREGPSFRRIDDVPVRHEDHRSVAEDVLELHLER